MQVFLAILCIVGLGSTTSAFMMFNKPEFPSRPNITLAGFKSGLLSLRSSMPVLGETASSKVLASKLSGKWKKIEEVGQDKAMIQLGLNIIFRKAAGLLRFLLTTSPSEGNVVFVWIVQVDHFRICICKKTLFVKLIHHLLQSNRN
uniref:Uncharacterized protein n=1 Tax=Cryptomonas curvata TaxID=233186 RepID=A0A7S0MMI9_9CRYP|mmetsp:Transcript_48313/g.100943  ORF Transcript_48313/g.100943 Transcript_48313/m.100943 type:complete len:146 (+) Transcript_48313:55-492(+)